jgi:diguanylate cyclase (GGDEF)-like protein
MNAPALRVLMVAGPGAATPKVLARSAFGPFEFHPCDGLDEAARHLAAERFDAVLLATRTPDARKLLSWPALSQATSEPALLVLTVDEPGAELTTLLVRQGVQDVLPLSIDPEDALPRAIRLAVERKSQDRLARKAYATDLTTGLPNQSQLLEHLSQLIALREREPAPMALLALRIEGLGDAQARLGSEPARVVRRKIAVRLRAALRASDVVASLSPDAFAVLLPRFHDVRDAEHVAAKLASALRAPFMIAGHHVALAAACGVAHYPGDGKDAAALLRRAMGLAASAPAEGVAGAYSQATAANDPAA